MCTPIVADSGSARKSVRCAVPDLPPQPIHADLICPRCYREAGFSSAESHVWCPTCGWIHTLTTEECETLVDALAGITDLNTQVYLQILAAQDNPAASLPDAKVAAPSTTAASTCCAPKRSARSRPRSPNSPRATTAPW